MHENTCKYFQNILYCVYIYIYILYTVHTYNYVNKTFILDVIYRLTALK